MNRQFNRNYRRLNREKHANRYRILAVFAAALLVGFMGYIGWASQSKSKQAFTARVQTWWIERKARIASQFAKPQDKSAQVAAAKKTTSSTPEPVHFEFYSMLPNPSATVSTEASPIFNHDNLEREFAKTVKKTAYVIHTGIYSNAASADKTRQVLAGEGLATKIVKAYIDDRLVYRVQIGPFEEKERVSAAQSKLAARGMHGVLRKIEEKIA